MVKLRQWSVLIASAFLSFSVSASEAASGTYVAVKSCDAYSSFTKGNNPGSVQTKPGAQYDIIEVNKAGQYDWLRIDIPSAEPHQRWVARECGLATLQSEQPDSADATGGKKDKYCHTANKQDSYVLAVTWQPGFCEHVGYKGEKPECNALNDGELVIDHLTLHGLWPNRKECSTHYESCQNQSGKPFSLREETISRIAPWMPNFYYSTTFGKYEWEKHGTCQSLPKDDYFVKAVSAVELVNASEIGAMIRNHIGASVNVATFFETIEKKYGAQVAKNVMLVCAEKNFLQEVRLKLPLNFSVDSDLPMLVGGSGFGMKSDRCGPEVRIEESGMN
jgi:ribonuclease T2